MNIIYETTKERGATILMPTSMVDSMSVALPAAMLAQGEAGSPALATKKVARAPPSSCGGREAPVAKDEGGPMLRDASLRDAPQHEAD